jgi:hypothetical protein
MKLLIHKTVIPEEFTLTDLISTHPPTLRHHISRDVFCSAMSAKVTGTVNNCGTASNIYSRIINKT